MIVSVYVVFNLILECGCARFVLFDLLKELAADTLFPFLAVTFAGSCGCSSLCFLSQRDKMFLCQHQTSTVFFSRFATVECLFFYC